MSKKKKEHDEIVSKIMGVMSNLPGEQSLPVDNEAIEPMVRYQKSSEGYFI